MDFEAFFELMDKRACVPNRRWHHVYVMDRERDRADLEWYNQYQRRIACNPSGITEEGEAFSRRFRRWWGMEECARRHPERDWMDYCSDHKIRVTTLPLDSKWLTPLSRRDGFLHRALASGIAERDVSRNGGFRFLSSLEKAFARLQTPADLKTWIALQRVGYNYFSWFRFHVHLNVNQFVPWDDFVWSLFIFIKAYEAESH